MQKKCPHVQVDIYESAHELAEIGAGIGMWPRIWQVCRALGIEEDLLRIRGSTEQSGQ